MTDPIDPEAVPTNRIHHEMLKQIVADIWAVSPSVHAALGAVISEMDLVVVDPADEAVCEELVRALRAILPGGSAKPYDM